MLSKLRDHVRTNIIGYIALFVASGGTALAAATVGSAEVIDNSLRSVDLRNHAAVRSIDVIDDTETNGGLQSADIATNALTGADINESQLGTVFNADRLDNLDSTAFVRSCQKGSIHGFVQVNGNLDLPWEYTRTGTSVAWNCAGSPPLVRGGENGYGEPLYVVCFPNNASIAGFGNAVPMTESSDYDNYMTWQRSPAEEGCPSNYTFTIRVWDDSGDLEKAPFFFALL